MLLRSTAPVYDRLLFWGLLVVFGTISIRAWLATVAAIGVIGAVFVGALAGWYSWREEEARLGVSLVSTSRAIVESLDRELDQAIALARGLAVSRALAEGDIAGFDAQARAALPRPVAGTWLCQTIGGAC
jgi:hypothetical protein